MITRESAGPLPTKSSWETADDALWGDITHPNGEWLFAVSSAAIARVLHLRTGKLALEHQFCDIVVPLDAQVQRVQFAIDFIGNVTAFMALVINEVKKEDYEGGGDAEPPE